MHSAYVDRLRTQLRGVCRWVLNAVPYIGTRHRRTPLVRMLSSDVVYRSTRRECRPTAILTEEWRIQRERKRERQLKDYEPRDQRWYCALIIWYVMSQCPEVLRGDEIQGQLLKALPILHSFKNQPKDGGTGALDDLSQYFLRWYHSHSLVEISKNLANENPDGFKVLNLDVDKHDTWAQNWQVKAEKSLRLFGQGRLIHQSLDNEVAYLSLLGDEIFADQRPLLQQGRSCISHARKIVKQRKETAILSPGRSDVVRWDPVHDIRSAATRPAPWELTCFGHHVPLSLGATSNPEACMKACKEFMLSDYTFMTSWDQSKTNAVGQWWDLTTSSIVCATLLDRYRQKMSMNDENVVEGKVSFKETDMSKQSDGAAVHQRDGLPDFTKRPQTPTQVIETKPVDPLRENIRKILELLREKTKPGEESEGFVWRRRHPQRLYHADTSAQSLEDTPQLFKLKQTRNVSIRPNVQKYLNDNDIWSSPDWSLENIRTSIPPVKLLHISCFDLALKADGDKPPEIGVSAKKGRSDGDYWQTIGDAYPLIKRLEEEDDRSLWLLYFIGKPDQYPGYESFPDTFKSQLRNPELRERLLSKYQASFFSVLNDSVSQDANQGSIPC